METLLQQAADNSQEDLLQFDAQTIRGSLVLLHPRSVRASKPASASISCSRRITSGQVSWKVKVIKCHPNDDLPFWLFIGIHASPATAAKSAIKDSSYYGITLTQSQTSIVAAGEKTNISLIPSPPKEHDIFTATLDFNGCWFKLTHPSWPRPREVELPPGEAWFPHFKIFNTDIALV